MNSDLFSVSNFEVDHSDLIEKPEKLINFAPKKN